MLGLAVVWVRAVLGSTESGFIGLGAITCIQLMHTSSTRYRLMSYPFILLVGFVRVITNFRKV